MANITHEFRTPIQTILATLDLLSETDLDSEQSEYLQQMHFSAKALSELVNDFLDFSKLESGQFRFEYIPYSPLQLAEQTVDLLAIEAHNKGIEIITDIDFALPNSIVGDPTRIRQVLLNLLKNAVKFTAKGYVQASVFADESARTISFAVKDSGIGISDEGKRQLFTSFYQTDASHTRKYGGTGLGLAISKSFVDLMGGSIKMEDNPEGGSIFSFTLPYSLPEKDGNAEEKPGALDSSITQGEKLLVVDDQISFITSLKRKLNFLGFANVATATSGEEALGLLSQAAQSGEPFTQVFIDMLMPVMDGWRLSSEINQNALFNGTKLYLLIPEGQMGRDARMKRLSWFNGYLYKPVKRRPLVSLLTANAENAAELEAVDDAEAEAAERAQKPAGAAAALTAQSSAQKPAYERIAEGRKILIAEDHPVNQKLIGTFFRQFGASTVCCSDGQEAVDQIQQNRDTDIIFMDIQMPVKSGVTATQEIRALGIKTPIIACTANTDEADFQEYYNAGMNGILTKPFKKQAVYELLQTWFAKIAEGASPQKPPRAAEKPLARQVWNSGALMQKCKNSRDEAKKLVESFLVRAANLFSALHAAAEDADFAKIQHDAHFLYVQAEGVGAEKLADSAKQLELIAKAQSSSACAVCLKECTALFEEFNGNCGN